MDTKGCVLAGRFEHKVDAWQRVRLPASWYVEMGNPKRVVVMVDSGEKCLDLVPIETMEARMKVLRRKSGNDPEIQRVLKILGQNMEEVEVNSRHLIRISDRLLDFAGIRKKIVFRGCNRTAQLWNPTALRELESADC